MTEPAALRCVLLSSSLTFTGDWYVDASAPGCPIGGTGSSADPFCRISDAVSAASDGDTIHIAPGAYQGGVVVDRDLTLVGTAGAASTTVMGSQLGQTATNGFDVLPGADVTIEGLTITGGRSSRGGGVGTRGSLTLRNTTVSGNLASEPSLGDINRGGGIYVGAGGELTLLSSTVSGNTADVSYSYYGFGNGGGIFVGPGSVRTRLVDSRVVGNAARSQDFFGYNDHGRGGGISIAAGAGPVSIQGSEITDNYALTLTASNRPGGVGAGVYSLSSQPLQIVDSTVSGNTAEYGGGIQVVGTPLTITSSTISENSLTSNFFYGSGVDATDAESIVIRNSTISGHLAGGLVTRGVQGQPTLLSGVTITGNTVYYVGAGGWSHTGSPPGQLENTIIAGNAISFPTGPTGANELEGAFVSLGHNLIGEDTGSTGLTNGVLGDQVGSAGGPLDPELASLADNGGPTRTHALLSTSPAIDAASPMSFEALDQRGLPRPAGFADIGAFERDPGGEIPGCAGVPNSTGLRGVLGMGGTTSLAANDFVLTASSLPPDSFGVFLTSRSSGSAMPASSVGELCLGGSIGRFVEPGQIRNAGAAGSFSLLLDLARHPTPAGIVQVQPGETWFFQGWHRDIVAGAATSNFTGGIAATFR